ncbi:hypothetical protein BKA57DRAFT_540506 [Linnemannia elongata]|nr:hypothetical protein BKA57DRAFT_540506 [Linnemannia elongata]
MLAPVDMKNAKYATSIQALEPRLQAIVDLEDMVAELLRAFVDKVLQGQFVQVHRDEVAVIRPACKELYVTYVSKITPSSEARMWVRLELRHLLNATSSAKKTVFMSVSFQKLADTLLFYVLDALDPSLWSLQRSKTTWPYREHASIQRVCVNWSETYVLGEID